MSGAIPSYALDPLLRQDEFVHAVNSPGDWIFSALDLKTAADRLNWMHAPVRADEPSLGLFHVYRMLIGMSIEALLKGIIVAHGEAMVTNGIFNEALSHHKLNQLAKRIKKSAFLFTADDKKILANLEPYIAWAGKYPCPKKSEQMLARCHSSTEVALECQLWDRLYDHLKTVGWITKGGKRLPLTQQVESKEDPESV